MQGTLVYADWKALVRDAAADVGIIVNASDFDRAWLAGKANLRGWNQPTEWKPSLNYDRQVGARWLRPIITSLGGDAQALHMALDAVYQRFADPQYFRIYPDVPPVLATLMDNRIKLAIVSNWNWLLPELCASLGFGVNVVATSARIGVLKPHPRIFQWALARTGTDPVSTLHVGDREDADVQGALSIGIVPGLLRRTGRPRDSAAALKLTSLDEIPKVIDLLAQK